MTPQEAFDISTRGIISQGGPSMNGESCVYRARDGKKCAAGWLLPDSEYKPEMDGKKMTSRAIEFFVKSGVLSLIDSLQLAHDEASGLSPFWSYWKKRLQEIAIAYKLNPAVLEEIPDVDTNS